MFYKHIFTNVYSLSRSFLAIGNLITLIFTSPDELFPIDVFLNKEVLSANYSWNIFFIFGSDNIIYAYYISIFVLLVVVIGYVPQVTCWFQAWIAYSILKGAFITEGGDQITAILTLLLIPICFFDKRVNHWFKEDYFKYNRSIYISYFCYTCIIVAQLQMAVLYFDAAVEKLNVPEWRDGTATYYWFNHNLFGAPIWMSNLLGYFFKSNIFCPLITWSIILTEILMFCAFFMKNENKKPLFYLGVSFHFVIFLVHGLPAFGLAMLGGLVIYLIPIELPIEFTFNLKNLRIKKIYYGK